MTSNLVFALGTLLTWLGWALVFKLIVGLVRRALGDPVSIKSLGLTALVAALSIGNGALLTGKLLPEAAGFKMPLFWPVMPFSGWLVVGGTLMVLIKLVQFGMGWNDTERMSHLKSVLWWLAAVAIGLVWFRSDPASKITFLTGGIPFTVPALVTIALFAVVGVIGMVWASKRATTRGHAKAIATHAALIAGSALFGIPLLYLLLTSFKEDQDMTGLSGVVWVPKVTKTVPYMNPEKPLYEGVYRGTTVTGTILRENPGNKVQVDIFTPYAIRGITFEADKTDLKLVPRMVPVVTVKWDGQAAVGKVVEEFEDGSRRVEVMEPASLAGRQRVFVTSEVVPVREVGLRTQNYIESISYLPPEAGGGLVYLRNTLLIVVLSVIGTLFSSSIAAYAFSRMRFPGRGVLFAVLLSTMMLPGAVTMLPQFLIYRWLGWVDTLYPLWVPAFFGAAFNIFLLRQFFLTIPMELEDAAKIDGCSYWRTFWNVMLPQIKPALAVIAIWTFMGAWNNFMGPLIYINSPENMPIAYAVQLYASSRSAEPGLVMAFATMTIIPVLMLFFFTQRYFIEGVTLSGLGGR
jgi:multiple sugar transport system permease protein